MKNLNSMRRSADFFWMPPGHITCERVMLLLLPMSALSDAMAEARGRVYSVFGSNIRAKRAIYDAYCIQRINKTTISKIDVWSFKVLKCCLCVSCRWRYVVLVRCSRYTHIRWLLLLLLLLFIHFALFVLRRRHFHFFIFFYFCAHLVRFSSFKLLLLLFGHFIVIAYNLLAQKLHTHTHTHTQQTKNKNKILYSKRETRRGAHNNTGQSRAMGEATVTVTSNEMNSFI